MQIVSFGDNLHGMSKRFFWKKYFRESKTWSSDIFTQRAKGLLTEEWKKYTHNLEK